MSNYSNFFNLDPEIFDQDEALGWRKLDTAEQRIQAITAYLKANEARMHKGTADDRELCALMHFHIGQLLLSISDDNSSRAIEQFIDAEFDRNDRWNAYVAATIAYLRRDSKALANSLSIIISLEQLEGSHNNLSGVTQGLLKNLESGQFSYNKAI